MKNKVMILLILSMFAVPNVSATVEEVDIVNLFPDQESTQRPTQVVARFQSDSTTTFTANVYVKKPDMLTVKDGSKTLTVKSGAPRETSFTIDETTFNEFGTYKVIVNQTDNNVNDTFNFTITPRPIVDIEVGDLVKDPAEQNLDYIHINVNPTVGRNIGGNDFHDANITVSRITRNTTTSTGVQKELFTWVQPGISNETNDLEAVIDFTGAQQGTYQILVTFNISSCAGCPTFEEVEATSVRVRDNDINAMSAAIAVVLSLLMAGFLFAYLGLNLDPRNKIIAVLRLFLLLVAPLFVPVAAFTGGHFARETGFTAVGEYMNFVFLGTFFIWFTMLLIAGLLFYFDQTVRSFFTEDYDPDI